MTAETVQRAFGGGRPSRASGRVADPHSFWPTPQDCTVALLRFLAVHEPEAMDEARRTGVWEPACGDGAIGRVLEAMGLPVTATDLVARGYGRGGVDFLSAAAPPGPRVLITNPPFGDRGEDILAFIGRARQLRGYMLWALLVPSGFWHAAGRRALFEAWPPSWELKLTWRPDFTAGGNPTKLLCWYVWSTASQSGPDTRMRLLPRPAREGGLW
jgi:hypothetical protein